jgi:hypothetical protein
MSAIEEKPVRVGRIILILLAVSIATGMVISFCIVPLLAATNAWSSSDLCGNTVVKTITSSDKQYDAVAFLRDCGATTAFTPEVSILRHGEDLSNTGGNVFRGSYGETFIDITWASDTTLIIQYTISSRGSIQLQKNKMSDIEIQYQLIQP